MADDDEVVEEEQQVVQQHESETVVVTDVEKPLAPPKYEVRPLLGQKFQAQNVRDIIESIMRDQLMSRVYRSDLAVRWAKQIANAVRQKAQELDMNRYKLVVSTILLEMKGEGAKCAQRCIWDPETDDYADGLYRNDTIFCYTIAYGVYMY